ncbi:hypothetical protein LA080_012780 [Diaporthe eres]|nr:hypothetical protein LA080_012780 [Diaporthe eres]
MSKSITASLFVLLVALNLSSQRTYAAPAPWSFKIPGVKGGTYRPGSGWGDVAELDWKVQADAASKGSGTAAKGSSKNGGSYGATVAGAGIGTVAGTGGVTGGAIAGSQDLGYDYAG